MSMSTLIHKQKNILELELAVNVKTDHSLNALILNNKLSSMMKNNNTEKQITANKLKQLFNENACIKGIVHPKVKITSFLFTIYSPSYRSKLLFTKIKDNERL